jgi:hypothetical protein
MEGDGLHPSPQNYRPSQGKFPLMPRPREANTKRGWRYSHPREIGPNNLTYPNTTRNTPLAPMCPALRSALSTRISSRDSLPPLAEKALDYVRWRDSKTLSTAFKLRLIKMGAANRGLPQT